MSYNPYNQGPSAESGHGYGQPEQHEMQPYGQESYGQSHQQYGQQEQYGSPYTQQQQYGSPQSQQYGTPHTQQGQYGSPHQEQYGTPHQQQYGTPHQEQYGTPQQEQHLSPRPGGGNFLSQTDFLSRVSGVRQEIASLTTSIQNVATLHQQALASSDNAAQQQLDDLVAATQLKNTSIRSQIQQLKADTERTTDSSFDMKKRQFESLNDEFKKTIQRFLEEEKQYKQRYREQISRQYRIVNPEATEEEVQQAADKDWGDEGIFQTALRTNRSGQASAVLGNVRARHNDMLKIENSIMQLLDLLNILNEQIVMQGQVINDVAAKAEETNDHLGNANVQIEKGVQSARRARKLKWWCLGVGILIIIVIALGVGLGVALTRNATKTNNN